MGLDKKSKTIDEVGNGEACDWELGTEDGDRVACLDDTGGVKYSP